MRKTASRILSLSLLSVTALALTGCNKETRNQVTPYGNISDSKTAVSIQSSAYDIKDRELYNRLKFQYGYNLFTKNLESKLFDTELKQVKYEGDTKKDIDSAIAKAIYGTDELEKLKQTKEADLELARKKYVDTMAQQGVKISSIDSLKFDEITRDTEHVTFSKLENALIEQFKLEPAKKEASKAYLKDISDDEYIKDDNDKEIVNTYFIDEDDIELKYENDYKKHNTSHGIILRFNSLRDAEEAIKDVNNGNTILDSNNLEAQYIKLFNNYYNYKNDSEKLKSSTDINNNELTTFKTNSELTQLRSFAAGVETLFLDTLEDNAGLLKPMNIDQKYYLIFRANVQYKTETTKELSFNDLKQDTTKYNKIKQELTDSIIEGRLSLVSNKVYEDKLKAQQIKIYDPFLELKFADNYSFYDYISSSNNDYIFEGKDFNYKVDDFYKDLKSFNLNSTVVDLLLNKYLYNNEKSYLEENEQKDFEKALKDELKAFKKGEKTINKAYGEQLYLYNTYGYMTQSEVITNKMAENILNDYLADYISDSWVNDKHEINTEKTGFFNTLIKTATEVLETKTLFDMNIDHILISVDNDQDGAPDNMKTFVDSLSAEELEKFKAATLKLSKAILNEVKAIDRKDTLEKLNYIVEAFNNNEDLKDGTNWEDYKTYKFALKAESLGAVDESSVTKYVEEFKVYIEELFKKACTDKLDIPEDKEGDGILYFVKDGDGQDYNTLTYNDICFTEFGYHLISVNSYKEDSTKLNFELKAESDTSGYWKDLKVILDDKNVDDKNDDLYVITNIYNDKVDTPSFNQVFVYYVEKTNGEVTSIKSGIKNNLATLLDDVITKYKSTAFQKYLLIKDVFKNIDNSNLKDFNIESHLLLLKNTSEDYKTDSVYYKTWYDGQIDWTRK